jgi:ATPase subunit of ABC transporter with duplicated ATPase domains
MLSHPNFLLLDEPTNHLDMEAVITLNNAMSEFTGNMIFTTHDFHIMNTVANRIIELRPEGIVDRMIPFEEYVKEMRIRDIGK